MCVLVCLLLLCFLLLDGSLCFLFRGIFVLVMIFLFINFILGP